MSDPEILPPSPGDEPGRALPQGPSLAVLYSLLALALAAAIGLAALIVLPFYRRR